METQTNYTRVGLAVVLLLTGLVAAALWLSTGFDRKKYNIYTVYTQESVSGLHEDSPVRYNGVQVGFVYRVELDPQQPQCVRLLIKVQEDTPITESTRAKLIIQGITGSTYLGLSASSSATTPLKKQEGECYPVIPSVPSTLTQLERNLEQISTSMQNALTGENLENIRHILSNLQHISTTITQNSTQINATLQQLPDVINELQISVKQFRTTTVHMNEASRDVRAAMQAGKTSMDAITQQLVPPAVTLLRRFNDIAANLEQVSNQMRNNPAVIVRGNTPPKPGPGE